MIDLETTSTTKLGAVIVSIGAAQFNPITGEIGDTFEINVSRDSCKVLGLTENQETLDWWAEQTPEARKVLTDPNAVAIDVAIDAFNKWLYTLKNKEGFKINPKKMRPWGNSSDFDISILSAAYEVCNKEWPFLFWNHKDVRTVMSFIPFDYFKEWKLNNQRPGVYHNAADDCVYQAKFVHWAFKELGVEYFR